MAQVFVSGEDYQERLSVDGGAVQVQAFQVAEVVQTGEVFRLGVVVLEGQFPEVFEAVRTDRLEAATGGQELARVQSEVG